MPGLGHLQDYSHELDMVLALKELIILGGRKKKTLLVTVCQKLDES